MKYFTINELTRSWTADKRGIANEPTEEVKAKLTALVDNVLDPLREAWGFPIYVNSGYRCPALNRAVGGVATSQHMSGEAADISAGNKALNRELFELVQRLDLPFDQLIDERGYQWVHISYSDRNRHKVLHL